MYNGRDQKRSPQKLPNFLGKQKEYGIFGQKIAKALDYQGELLYNVCAYEHF